MEYYIEAGSVNLLPQSDPPPTGQICGFK